MCVLREKGRKEKKEISAFVHLKWMQLDKIEIDKLRRSTSRFVCVAPYCQHLTAFFFFFHSFSVSLSSSTSHTYSSVASALTQSPISSFIDYKERERKKKRSLSTFASFLLPFPFPFPSLPIVNWQGSGAFFVFSCFSFAIRCKNFRDSCKQALAVFFFFSSYFKLALAVRLVCYFISFTSFLPFLSRTLAFSTLRFSYFMRPSPRSEAHSVYQLPSC